MSDVSKNKVSAKSTVVDAPKVMGVAARNFDFIRFRSYAL